MPPLFQAEQVYVMRQSFYRGLLIPLVLGVLLTSTSLFFTASITPDILWQTRLRAVAFVAYLTMPLIAAGLWRQRAWGVVLLIATTGVAIVFSPDTSAFHILLLIVTAVRLTSKRLRQFRLDESQ